MPFDGVGWLFLMLENDVSASKAIMVAKSTILVDGGRWICAIGGKKREAPSSTRLAMCALAELHYPDHLVLIWGTVNSVGVHDRGG